MKDLDIPFLKDFGKELIKRCPLDIRTEKLNETTWRIYGGDIILGSIKGFPYGERFVVRYEGNMPGYVNPSTNNSMITLHAVNNGKSWTRVDGHRSLRFP